MNTEQPFFVQLRKKKTNNKQINKVRASALREFDTTYEYMSILCYFDKCANLYGITCEKVIATVYRTMALIKNIGKIQISIDGKCGVFFSRKPKQNQKHKNSERIQNTFSMFCFVRFVICNFNERWYRAVEKIGQKSTKIEVTSVKWK